MVNNGPCLLNPHYLNQPVLHRSFYFVNTFKISRVTSLGETPFKALPDHARLHLESEDVGRTISLFYAVGRVMVEDDLPLLPTSQVGGQTLGYFHLPMLSKNTSISYLSASLIAQQ